jgi:predicted metal-binding membrane protein
MTRVNRLVRALLFAGSYLVVWGLAGIAAYGVYRLGRTPLGHELAWSRGGRWTAGVLAVAAVYEPRRSRTRAFASAARHSDFSSAHGVTASAAPSSSAHAMPRGASAAAGR